METKVDLSKYTVNVQGKDFVTFSGLLALAHEKGLTSIETELVNSDLTNPVIKATVKFGDKTFTGYGDANTSNVAKKVAGALIRMAETRSLARALRFACNVDMAAIEELDAEENVISNKKPITSAPKTFKRTTLEVANEQSSISIAPTEPKVEVAQPTPVKRSFSKRPKQEPNFP